MIGRISKQQLIFYFRIICPKIIVVCGELMEGHLIPLIQDRSALCDTIETLLCVGFPL